MINHGARPRGSAIMFFRIEDFGPPLSKTIIAFSIQQNHYQSEGFTERINEPPWGRCLQGVDDARWVVVVVVVVVVVASQGGVGTHLQQSCQ